MSTPVTGVFNVTNGLGAPWNVPGLYADGTNADQNTKSLQAMIQWLITSKFNNILGPTLGKGGTLEFPPGIYAFNSSILVGQDLNGSTQPYQVIFKGDGQGAEPGAILQQTQAKDLFLLSTNVGTGDADIGGTVFQDLLIQYDLDTVPTAPPAAFHVENGSQGVRLYRVTMLNWPIGVYLDNSYRASIIDCSLHMSTTKFGGIGLLLGDPGAPSYAIETYIAGCLFLDDTHLSVAVEIYGCEHLRMTSCRLEGWLQGILIQPVSASGNAEQLYFSNVSCFPYNPNASPTICAALVIQPGGGSYVTQATFVGCELSAPQGNTQAGPTDYSGAGILIQDGGGGTNYADQIRFVDCHSCLWNGPGMYISLGSNIEVLGGYYSCNGANPNAPYRTGIAINGRATGLRINGAACNNSLFYILKKAFVPATQNYGIDTVFHVKRNLRRIASPNAERHKPAPTAFASPRR